jgi:iron(III) transport system ATP-binding protein
MPYLETRGLAYRYGEFGAVENINLALEKGEFLSLLGPSGCGKTTTLKMLAGFLTPSAGEIILKGDVIASEHRSVLPNKRNMPLIFQSYAIWPHMTVFQNIAYGLRIRKVPRSEVRERVRRVMEVVGLVNTADRYPHTLSGGQQQRVALARGLVIEPDVLLLDEPLSNLDAALRAEMRTELRRLHDELRMTTVYVTHDQTEALMLSDRVAVLNSGKVEQLGSPRDIYESPATPFVAKFMGNWNCLDATVDASGLARLHGAPNRTWKVGARAQGNVVLCVPVDALEICRAGTVNDGDQSERMVGTVKTCTYQGDHIEHVVILDNSDAALRITSPRNFSCPAGTRVNLSVCGERCVAIPG